MGPRRLLVVSVVSLLWCLRALAPPCLADRSAAFRSRLGESRASSRLDRARRGSSLHDKLRSRHASRTSASRGTASNWRSNVPKKKALGGMPQITGNLSAPEMPEPTICQRYSLREIPSFNVPQRKCPSAFFDWSPVAIVGAHLADPQAILPDTSTPELKKLEVILLEELRGWEAPSEAHQAALLARFSGSNHFLIYSKDPIGQEDAYNRLVAMAGAEVVAIVQPGEEGFLTEAMLWKAAILFGQHERLGAVGFGIGWSDGKLVQSAGDQAGWAMVDAVISGPVFVRHRAFLEAGSLWAHCEKACMDASMADLTLRMWEASYAVGLADAPGDSPGAAGRRQLQAFWRRSGESQQEAGAPQPRGRDIATNAQRLKLTLARARAHVQSLREIYKLPPTPMESPEPSPLLTDAGRSSLMERLEAVKLAAEELQRDVLQSQSYRKELRRQSPAVPLASEGERGTVAGPPASRPPKHKSERPRKAWPQPRPPPPPASPPPPPPPPVVQEKLSELVKAPSKALANRPCASSIIGHLKDLKASTAAQAAAERRRAVLEDLSYDTVQNTGKGFGMRRHNQDAMQKAWGDKRHRPITVPINVCAGVSPESAQEHRCPPSQPAAGMVMQYFKRPQNIAELSRGISSTTRDVFTELIINDDSRSDVVTWLSELRDSGYGGNVFISLSPNIHEIRGYNRLSKFSMAHYLVHMQDDDVPKKQGWLEKALILFKNLPRLAVLGGLRGRMDFGMILDSRYNYINGPKYGPSSDKRGCCKKIVHWEPKSKIPFMYMYKVNLSPIIVPRTRFLAMGMYHLHFSCAGDPGIGLDFELSIRAWRLGFRTGLYPSDFKLQIGESRGSGTRSNEKMYRLRKANELRNNQVMYSMYKGFHHKEGNYKAASALKTLPAPKNWEPMNDAGGTRDFLKLHRGWYLSNKVANTPKARSDFNGMFAELMVKGKGT